MELFETLEALVGRFGPSGQEEDVAQAIEKLAEPYAQDIRRDALGNLIVHVGGAGPKLMLTAHMDTVGVMVTHVADNGLLRVGKLGWLQPRELPGTPVRFRNGTLGCLYEDEGLEDKKREMGQVYLDIGARDGQEARERVQVGDMAVFHTPLYRTGRAIVGPGLDDRLGCAVLLTALAGGKPVENDLYLVFTVQEEVGLRGAGPAAFAVAPDYAVAVDVTPDGTLPGNKHEFSSRCGGGAALKVLDSSVIAHPQMVALLEERAREGGIACQRDVLSGGGTDAGAIHVSRGGVVTGGLSIPCRYTHTPQERCELADALACVELVQALWGRKLPALGR